MSQPPPTSLAAAQCLAIAETMVDIRETELQQLTESVALKSSQTTPAIPTGPSPPRSS